MKKTLLRIGSIVAGALLIGTWFIAPKISAYSMDCDSNAVIYCGAYTPSDLARKIQDGTGKPYQSHAELEQLYSFYGVNTNEFNMLQEGRVTKTNEVYIGTTRVDSNVYSMGRHYMNGSIAITNFGYPLYLRHPSVSFVSSSIPAWVMMNSDGTMRYAIIKSCGNIVPGRIPAPLPRYNLEIRKWNDLDRDGNLETGEPYLPDWRFQVTGNGVNQTVATNANGSVVVPNLLPGTYNVSEIHQEGWNATTADRQSVNLDQNRVVYFGNARIPAPLVRIQIIKFNDVNANRSQDSNESTLSGWSFRVTGNGETRTYVTDTNGRIEVPNLNPGNFTVTEINQTGWENTTGLTINREVTTDPATQVFVFGNRRVETPENPGGGDLPTSGPAETAAAAGASMTLSGSILAYIRSKKNFLKSLIK